MRTVMTQSCCFGHHDKATIIAWSADHGDCESYDFIKNIGLEMLANELLLSIPRTRAHQSSGTGSQRGSGRLTGAAVADYGVRSRVSTVRVRTPFLFLRAILPDSAFAP